MFVTGYPSEILRKKEGRQSYMATITLGEKNRVLLLPALRRLDGSRIAGDAAVSYLMSLVQIERPGPIALQSLRDVIKFYPLHMRWGTLRRSPRCTCASRAPRVCRRACLPSHASVARGRRRAVLNYA